MRAILLGALLCAACGSAKPSPEARWGIKPLSLRSTLGGSMLDFRYQVVDPDKAKQLWDRKLKPYLFDPASRQALGMPEDTKLGALRASLRNPPVKGKHYYVLFSNGYGTVRNGSRVTVVLGDCKIENLVVEGDRS
jgi:hypothetical protein